MTENTQLTRPLYHSSGFSPFIREVQHWSRRSVDFFYCLQWWSRMIIWGRYSFISRIPRRTFPRPIAPLTLILMPTENHTLSHTCTRWWEVLQAASLFVGILRKFFGAIVGIPRVQICRGSTQANRKTRKTFSSCSCFVHDDVVIRKMFV